MLSNIKSPGYFAVLQTICNQPGNILLATRQQRHSVSIVELKRFEMAKSVYKMFEIFIAGPDLPRVDRPDAFRKSFQGMSAVEDTPCAFTKGADHAVRLGALTENDGSGVGVRAPQLVENLETGLRAVLKLFADKSDMGFVCPQFANDRPRTSRQCLDCKAFFSLMSECTLQQLSRNVISRDDEHTNKIFW
jgi:hypothetical protein